MVSADAVALPDVGAKIVYFVMEGMVDGDFILPVFVDGVGQKLESNTVAIVSVGWPPCSSDEKVGVYGFMEERVDGV